MWDIFNKSSEHMHEISDESAHLIITSPPYNVAKPYEIGQTYEEWKGLLRRVIEECMRILVIGGRLTINVASVDRKPMRPLMADVLQMCDLEGFLFWGDIIWDKGASAGKTTAWGSWCSASSPCLRGIHEYILVFVKGSFKRSDQGESTITRDRFLELVNSVWRFQTETSTNPHPAPFPVELPARLIDLYSYAGDVIVDPFCGGGTTGVAAIRAGRRFIGYDTDLQYSNLARYRLRLEQYKKNPHKGSVRVR